VADAPKAGSDDAEVIDVEVDPAMSANTSTDKSAAPDADAEPASGA
jgi:hypothetical protein